MVLASGLAVMAVVVAVRTEQLEADRESDGIPDCRERIGLRVAGTSAVLKTDPSKADTDGDLVSDGSEVVIGTPPTGLTAQVRDLLSCRALTYAAWSDPTLADTDGDGLDDAIELSEGTDPYAGDSDRDGLDDADERTWGSDPYVGDTDVDGLPDGKDVDDGLSPITVDIAINDEKWHSEYARGVGLGEFDDIDSVPQLLGALSGGMSGSIPLVGWVVSTLGDVRDAIAGIVKEDWSAVLTSAAAVLPYAGDSSKAVRQITKFVEKHPEQLRRVVEGILALEKVPESVRATLLRAADRRGVDGLRKWNVSDEVIIEFAKRGTKLATLVAAMAKASALIQKIPDGHADDDGFVRSLTDAQAALREYAVVADKPRVVADGQVYFERFPISTFVGGRLIDACTECTSELGDSSLRIAKLASLHYSEAIQGQIDKDAFLIGQGHSLEWHFYAGPTGWTVDIAVLDSLGESGIPFVVHLPD